MSSSSRILIVEVAGFGTMAGDRGKFQLCKTAMAAHYSLLYFASKKHGAAIAVLRASNFPLSPAMVTQPATLTIIIRKPLHIWICHYFQC